MRRFLPTVLIAISLSSLHAEEPLKPTQVGDNFAYYEKTTTTEIKGTDDQMVATTVAEFPSIPTAGYSAIRVVTRTTGLFKFGDGRTVPPSVIIQICSLAGGESTIYAATQTVGYGETGNGAILEAPVAGPKTRVAVVNRTTLPGKMTVTCSVYLIK